MAIAHNLGLQVGAEGIDTVGQLELVQALIGCEYGQGYHFACLFGQSFRRVNRNGVCGSAIGQSRKIRLILPPNGWPGLKRGIRGQYSLRCNLMEDIPVLCRLSFRYFPLRHEHSHEYSHEEGLE